MLEPIVGVFTNGAWETGRDSCNNRVVFVVIASTSVATVDVVRGWESGWNWRGSVEDFSACL
jgi:hypothetical protein